MVSLRECLCLWKLAGVGISVRVHLCGGMSVKGWITLSDSYKRQGDDLVADSMGHIRIREGVLEGVSGRDVWRGKG